MKEANAFFGTNGADDAAKEVLNALTALAHQAQLEIGGYINKMTTRSGMVYYQYTKPMVGERKSVSLPVTYQIGYHTHPYIDPINGLRFSHKGTSWLNGGTGGDAEWVRVANNHLYVGAMAGNDVAGAVKIGICEYKSTCETGLAYKGNPPTRIIQ
uniref:DUF4329 domain-containing protein n=1 Tax=Rheinheimera sp. BAL341 TaxID=1708203 RepID=A0A486XSE5_9GAMM